MNNIIHLDVVNQLRLRGLPLLIGIGGGGGRIENEFFRNTFLDFLCPLPPRSLMVDPLGIPEGSAINDLGAEEK